MKILLLALALSSWLLYPGKHGMADEGLRIATFSVDITPQLGLPVGQGFIPVLQQAEHPLLARGILLADSGMACVLCSLDLMEVHNDSYDFLRQTIAAAAKVPESRVALHCLHQHTAPAIDTAAQRLELAEDNPRRQATAEYLAFVAKQLSTAIHGSQENWQRVTDIGTARAKVERVASNRRLEQADGSILGRSSSTATAPELRELPEGLIDPWVRTVSLHDGQRAVAHLHYYASHPQSFYGDGRASYDVPGMIRQELEKKTGTFQLYLTGCGGDVAFGKYNDGSPQARADLAARLQAGMEHNLANLERTPITPMKWAVERMVLPLRSDQEFSEAANQQILDTPKADAAARRKAAIALAWIQRVQSGKPVELSCLSIGPVKLLHLPGEPFVQYQLSAQKMRPDRFVCVAGYGDCGMGYIGGDRIYTDRGGYEQTYAFAGPCEALLLSTIERLLPGQRQSIVDAHGIELPLPPFYSDKLRLLHWLDDAGESQVIDKPAEWRHRRGHVLQNMSRVMGPLPERDGTPLDVQVVSSERLETLTRKKITYLSSQGDRVPAYLLIPHDIQRPRPAMLCLHGTSGPKGRTAGLGEPYPRYTLELAKRGYVTIAPDYTLLGENQTDPAAVGYVSGTMKGVWNHMRAVDLLVSLPEVDAERIGCCGVSLGGHNSLFVGVFDLRLKVVVTSSGFDSFLDYMDGDPTGWCQTRYMPRIETVFDKDPRKLPFDFPEVLAAIAPRHLYVHAPLSDTNFKVDSARRCVAAAKQVYGLLDAEPNLVAVYPEGKHGFPPDQREAAYRFIDEVLQWHPPEN